MQEKLSDFDFYRNPFEYAYGLEYSGKFPVKNSRELKNTIMGIGMETLDRDSYHPADYYDLLGESGVKYARCQTGWMKCEKEKGVYRFEWLDELVDELRKRGIKPWFSVGFGNRLYTPVPEYERILAEGGQVSSRVRGYTGEVPLYHGEEAMRGFLAYVRALAEHFQGRVSEWEIWNEPDIFGHFWNFHGKTPYPELSAPERTARCASDYATLIRRTGSVIRSVIPDAVIAACSATAASEYLRFLGKCGISEFTDVFCYHLYGNNENYTRRKVEFARGCLGNDLVFWQGESGRPTGKSTLFAFPTPYTQAKYIARRAMLDLACGAKRSSIFTVTDFINYYPDGSNQFFGVIDGVTKKPKSGYFALQTMATLLENTEPAHDLMAKFNPVHSSILSPAREYNMETVLFRRNGYPAVAVWIPETVDLSIPPVTGELQFLAGEAEAFENPILIDTLRRNVYRIRHAQYPEWGGGVAVINPIPVPDYPVVLASEKAFPELQLPPVRS